MDQEKGLIQAPVAREGLWLIAPSLCITLVLLGFGFFVPGTLFALLTLFFLYFFRNPKRLSSAGAGALISPADGRVIDIGDVEEGEFLKRSAQRIAIFMSPFDVHVNRAPASGRVVEVSHRKGRFAAAFRHGAEATNERNYMLLDSGGLRPLVVQIAGFLARRIICYAGPGDDLRRGDAFGMIAFGSRVDLYLPEGYTPVVQLQEKVKAGVTVLAERRG